MGTNLNSEDDLRRFPPDDALQTCSKSHRLDACYQCLDRYVNEALDSRGAGACEAIECPQTTCNHVFTFDEIKKITIPATFARYDELLTRKFAREQPNFRWCLHPGCGSGAIYYTEDVWEELGCRGIVFEAAPPLTEPGRYIQCRECGFGMCFTHQGPCLTSHRTRRQRQERRHWSRSAQGCAQCRQELLNKGSETNTDTWIASNTKPCPGPECGVPIEKNMGCSHMTCAVCHFQFCWECLSIYDDAHLDDRGCERQREDIEADMIGDQHQPRTSISSDDLYWQAELQFEDDFGVRERFQRLLELGYGLNQAPHPGRAGGGTNGPQYDHARRLQQRQIRRQIVAARAREAMAADAGTSPSPPNTNADTPFARELAPSPGTRVPMASGHAAANNVHGAPPYRQPDPPQPLPGPIPQAPANNFPRARPPLAPIPWAGQSGIMQPFYHHPVHGPPMGNGDMGGWQMQPLVGQWAPLPAHPMAGYYNTYPPLVPYNAPGNLAYQHQGYQVNNSQGTGQANGSNWHMQPVVPWGGSENPAPGSSSQGQGQGGNGTLHGNT